MNNQEGLIEESHSFPLMEFLYLLPNEGISQNNEELHDVLIGFLSRRASTEAVAEIIRVEMVELERVTTYPED